MNAVIAPIPKPADLPDWSLPIEGMTCASCVSRVEKALLRVPGVVRAEVNLATETAAVTAATRHIDEATLVAAVERAGDVAKPQRAESVAYAGPLPTPAGDPQSGSALRSRRPCRRRWCCR